MAVQQVLRTRLQRPAAVWYLHEVTIVNCTPQRQAAAEQGGLQGVEARRSAARVGHHVLPLGAFVVSLNA